MTTVGAEMIEQDYGARLSNKGLIYSYANPFRLWQMKSNPNSTNPIQNPSK